MAYVKVCSADLLGPGGMAGFYVDGVEILIVRDRDGVFRAFDGICPHQDSPLAEGYYDGAIITCATHGWMFNAETGRGVNPPNCKIAAYPLKIEGNEILVDPDTEIKS
jgi:toluene monooxygenase system ferredoxin subunit